MLKTFASLLIVCVFMTGCNSDGTCPLADCCATKSKASAMPKLRHVVLFKFKDGTTPEQVKAIEEKFASLPGSIKEIKAFEWGTNNSPEGKADGFTHCFLVTFADEAGRAAYLPHPSHDEFVKLVGPSVDKVLVVDYFAK